MKMDYEIIRAILLKIEEAPTTVKITESFLADGNLPEDAISFHVELLVDGGYIEAISVPVLGAPYKQHIIKRMTFAGHEYLNAVRDNTVWNKTKKRLTPLGSVTLDIVKSVASDVILKLAGL